MIQSLWHKYKDVPVTVKASIAYTLCSILQNALGFVTLPLFTRLLTTKQFGQYSIYASWGAILVIFTTFNLPYGSFNTAMIKFENDRDKYISNVQNICLLFSMIFLIIYLPFSQLWNRVFELPTLIMVTLVIETLGKTVLQFWMGKERFDYHYKKVIFITLLIAIISPILSFYLIMNFSEKGYARIAGYAIVNIIVGAIFFVYNYSKGKEFFNKKYWIYALKFNIPLIPYYLSQTIFNQSDKLMINAFSGTEKAGIYSLAYSLGIVLVFVLNAINNSYVPWFYKKLKSHQGSDNIKIANLISILMAVLLLGVIITTPELIAILGGEQYQEAIWVVPPVAMSLLLQFYSQLFINVEFYHEKRGLLVLGTIGAAVLNIVLNAILIPIAGYIAAGYTTLASYLFFALANYYGYLKTKEQAHIDQKLFNLRQLIVIFIVFMTLTFICMLFYKLIMIRYIIVFIAFIFIVIFRTKIIGLLKLLKE
ncbi:oligosaccharide flippase family protein [Eggerthia catenaformis]|uniref:lipopolysaccharide biosynthesis protein n=1 Tax=Eggerthia catenaformis TaxID=31973 RepID=UPI0028E2EFBD|nr:oligosaccharide flippase family protein [Eggerthia catenaformis]